MDGHPQPPSPLVVSLGDPAPPGGVSLFGRWHRGDVPMSRTVPAQQRDAIPLGERTQGPTAMKLIRSLELGGHLVDTSLGAVVVLARRPGHADRTDHVVADLNRQTTG